MEENNILNKGVYILYEIKDDLAKNNELKERALQLQEDERRFAKQLDSTKKAEATEINTTINKRRGEIESTFSAQLNKTRNRMKKAQSQRANAKNSKVSKRIEEETQELREEIRSNKEEIRSIFSRNGIPGIFNNKYCFSIFRPGNLGDYGIIGLTLLVLLVLPILFNLLFFSNSAHPVVMVLMYMIILGGFIALYIFIRKKIYIKHRQEMKDAIRFRTKITGLKRRIAKKEQNIRMDSDESRYELEKFDDEINDIQQQIDNIVEEKKNAMTLFETQTRRDIISEIHTRYAPEIEEDQKQLDETRTEKHKTDSELNDLTVRISKNYETYLGKEILDTTIIDSLIEIMDNGNAQSVSEAVDYYKKTVDKGLQTI